MSDETLACDLGRMAQIFYSILSFASIQRIVVVDDSYAHAVQASVGTDELMAYAQANRGLFATVIPTLESIEDDEFDLISKAVKEAISNPTVLQQAASLVPSEQWNSVDAKTMEILKSLHELMPKEPLIEYLEVSGAEWESRKDELLAASQQSGILVLFDRDFKGEGKGPDHGLRLIADLLASNTSGVFCALLSNTITPLGELEQWSALSKEHEIARDRFIVVSKQRLSHDEQDIAGFVRLMRLAVLCGPLQTVRNRVFEHFANSIELTRERLNSWSVFDFDEAVFGSSRSEGVWEIDTLLRVISTVSLHIVRHAVLSDAQVHQLTVVARRASSILIPQNKPQLWSGGGEMALEYQRAELYRESDYLNPNHLPIESGDVFEQIDNGAKFVLVAQPCDLMVRGRATGCSGGRAYDDKHSRMVALCPIRTLPKSGSKDMRGHNGSHVYELKYWEKMGESGLVNFSDIQMTRLAVLDLCVFRADGQAIFEVESLPPDSLTDAWGEHFKKLKSMFSKEFSSVTRLKQEFIRMGKNVDKLVKETAIARMLPCCSIPGKFKVRLVDSTGFAFGLRRVRRLEATLAADVVRAFASHQSRTAFDRPVMTDELSRHVDGNLSSDE
jgi:hypothetical protein